MNNFAINLNSVGGAKNVFQIHNMSAGCSHFSHSAGWKNVGRFNNWLEARDAALQLYPEVNGCVYCCGACYANKG